MNAEDFVAKLKNVRRTRNGWDASCPAHDDKNASLSIRDENGKILLNCHAKCDPADIARGAGVSLSALGRRAGKATKDRVVESRPVGIACDPALARAGAKRFAAAQLAAGWKMAVHAYTDARGNSAFWRIRCKNPKTGEKWIRPMFFDGSDFVLGEPKPPKAGKPIYSLANVLASAGAVFVVEGESCVEALQHIGIVATTSGGADSAEAADWSPLAGRAVVVWSDRDNAGEKYGASVAEQLRSVAASVELIDVATLNLDEKGDAVDWLGAHSGATAADVLALPRTAPPKNTADHLFDNLVPISPDIWAAAAEPHPHVFQDGHVGIFPVGEVTVIGSPGRTGKTTSLVVAATRHLLGESFGGLPPTGAGPIVVLSAEDKPTQFARKLLAAERFVKPELWRKVKQGFMIPDFYAPILEELRQLVALDHGQPAVAPEVATIVEALGRLQASSGIGAVFIETASTWNAANEDNPSFRALIAAAKQIARSLNVAVVLTHHVNQTSGNNLPTLNVSVADLRGGTTFVDNARQVALVVNLGSADNPVGEGDSDYRRVLRAMVAPTSSNKVTALVFLNSSQGDDVPPLFFEWMATEFGPACVEVVPPAELRGRKWYAVREMVKLQRQGPAESARAAKVQQVVSIVNSMHKLRKAGGKSPTARGVSKIAGHSDTWAADALKEAVDQGLLSVSKEKVDRVKEKVDVYRPIAPNGPSNE